ncbi:MAG: glycerate kinase [Candidatus Obscuribacterales bacterium]|nr:glycerate kinase [Candidatus Obscuribacterales bacterium]
MLKILIAPSALKGTISPVKVAEAIQAGVIDSELDCQLELAPLADGGDGTLESLHFALGGSFEYVDCHGPLGAMHTASWLQLPGLAIVELASACGLALLQGQELEPLSAHTLGLGEVIHDCLSKGQGNIVVTLGGSASTDGGTGALHALGAPAPPAS